MVKIDSNIALSLTAVLENETGRFAVSIAYILVICIGLAIGVFSLMGVIMRLLGERKFMSKILLWVPITIYMVIIGASLAGDCSVKGLTSPCLMGSIAALPHIIFAIGSQKKNITTRTYMYSVIAVGLFFAIFGFVVQWM